MTPYQRRSVFGTLVLILCALPCLAVFLAGVVRADATLLAPGLFTYVFACVGAIWLGGRAL